MFKIEFILRNVLFYFAFENQYEDCLMSLARVEWLSISPTVYVVSANWPLAEASEKCRRVSMATITELKSGELILQNCNNASYNSGYDYFDSFLCQVYRRHVSY